MEGATDRAFIAGLKQRWCPDAQLVEGHFRGSTGLRLRAEIPKICQELYDKECDIIVILTDSNTEIAAETNAVLNKQKRLVPSMYDAYTVSGVAQRNVESWLCADRDWIAQQIGETPNVFDVSDPKDAFEAALKVTRADRKEDEIANLVARAPLKQWINRNRSFERFYDDLRGFSNANGCPLPDER